MRYFFGAGEVLPNPKTIKLYSALLSILWFSMFSLSAQTPRKDSGANGLDTVRQVLVGNRLPADFWDQKVKIYKQGDTAIVDLAQFKGKSFILDFWSTTCGACIAAFPDLVPLQKQFADELNILLVNSYGKKDTYQRIHHMPDDVLRTNNLTSIYADDYLIKLFPHDVYPFYVWVDANERVAAITLKRSVIPDHVNAFLKNYHRYDKAN